MNSLQIGVLSIVAILALIALRTPIGVALGAVSFAGFCYLRNVDVALSMVREVPYSFAASWDLTAIPMFLLMGSITSVSGISGALFRAARLWFSGLPGGLAVATNIACAGFAAACGSSVAASAAMGRLAIPEMLRQGYDKSLATGVVASAGTLAALIPPSILFVLFGVFAQVSVVDLLMAGVLPGLLTAAVYTGMILVRCRLNPALAPPLSKEELATLKVDRWASLKDTWPLIALILGIIGGLYGGVVTATEAGAFGSTLSIVIATSQRRLDWKGLLHALRDAVGTTAQIFFVGMGAVLFTKLLALTGMSDYLVGAFGTWAQSPALVVSALSVVYLVLGCFLDPLGIMLITMPVFLPMFKALGLDLVWLGVLVVKYIEIGMLTPPLGMNVFVVKNVAPDIPLETIFKGVGWFLACEIVVMGLLIAYPQISLFLPNAMK